jgi:hypothetical protein
MKKILFIASVVVFSLASCKKDHTCTCTSTIGGVTGTPVVTTYTKTTKGEARANCLSSTQTSSTNVLTTTTCSLK